MNTRWPTQRLGEFLRPNRRPYTLAVDEDANLVGMRLYGGGPFHRELKPAMQIAKKSHFVIRAGDVIYNKLFAWKGTFGIVPPTLDGMLVSDKFPTYELDRTKVDENWLRWYFRYPPLWEEAQSMSTGSAALSKLTLNPPKLLLLTMPVPRMEEQRRVVARIEELAAQVQEAQILRRQTAEEAGQILSSKLHLWFVAEENSWPRSTVGDCADIIDPNPSHRMPVYAETGFPFISTVDFEGSEGIRKKTAKYVSEETYLEQKSRCSFANGDILYSRIGTIGTARLLAEVWPFALSHVLVVVKAKPEVEPRFLLWYLRSDSIVFQASEATRSVGVPDLGIKRIRGFHMPKPSVPEQRRIVAYLDDLQEKAGALRALQNETSAALNALVPSILDRAFRGEL